MVIETKYDIGQEVTVLNEDGTYHKRRIMGVIAQQGLYSDKIEITYIIKGITYKQHNVFPLSVWYEKEVERKKKEIEQMQEQIVKLSKEV